MNPKPGEIYLIDLGMVGKVRPAVVVSREDANSPRATAICVPLTTQHRESPYECSLGKPKFLGKPSWANVQGLSAVGHEKLLRLLGRLTMDQLAGLRECLRYALELEEQR